MVEIKLNLSDKTKDRIDSISGKPIEQFCQDAVEEVITSMEEDIRLSFA